MPASKHDLIRLALESRHDAGDGGCATNKAPRFRLHDATVTCEVYQPGGSRNHTEVILVEISEHGAHLVYPGYLHAGTEFWLSLSIPGRPVVKASGCSRWCQFLTGRHHAVGIRFREPLRVRDLVDPAAWMEAYAAHPESEVPVAGTIAIFAEDDLSLDAMDFQLRTTQAERVRAQSRGALLDLLVSGRVTALVLDGDGDESSVIELLTVCRQKFFEGPVLLVSLDQEASFAVDLDPLRRCRFVPKPMRSDSLVGALRDILREHPECVVHSAPIYSESPETADRQAMLDTYILRCRQMLEDLRQQAAHGRRELMLGSLRSIAGSAGSYGFPPLAEQAMRCVQIASSDGPDERVTASVESLDRVIDRLRSTRPGEDGKADPGRARAA